MPQIKCIYKIKKSQIIIPETSKMTKTTNQQLETKMSNNQINKLPLDRFSAFGTPRQMKKTKKAPAPQPILQKSPAPQLTMDQKVQQGIRTKMSDKVFQIYEKNTMKTTQPKKKFTKIAKVKIPAIFGLTKSQTQK